MADTSSIRGSSSLLQEALAAGRKRMADQGLATPDMSETFERMAREMLGGSSSGLGAALTGGLTDPAQGGATQVRSAPQGVASLREGLTAIDAEVRAVNNMEESVLAGKVQDFHEVAAQIKRADLALSYAMEIRNRLIDAYRETMRMSV
ncbi:flagellar hook-basal body complex protein FliE [Engelhardtia mirabilis]|uniref:Flagellar hook-basal body complex protein FliE n=1 Tax=Engelhardtia mirabilis TaxID=2528011 RepID=A0A518BST1_9BACT|nr:flagellar hook-basal body protein FliE [Planctomycetes bacterium Pla133]QDV04350.1 flagellar hook-basal body protein FliE [Planctomycetes bacterium Pla86]